jgi:hypothetical protein
LMSGSYQRLREITAEKATGTCEQYNQLSTR